MEDASLFEKVRHSHDDKEKMNMIQLIQDENKKEMAIYFLDSDYNKLLMASSLKNETAKARLYGRLIKNKELVDYIIKEVHKLNRQGIAAVALSRMPDSDFVKKANAIADLYIISKEADDESRKRVSEFLRKMYIKQRLKNPNYTFLDFLNILKNDYSIASVIANISISSDLGEVAGEEKIEDLPYTDDEKRTCLTAIRDKSIRKQIELIYSSRDELINKFNISNVPLIKLPKDMTIGVELEAEGESASAFNGIKICERWLAEGDASLERGVEVVSPILHDSEEDMMDLAMVCQIMKQCQLETSYRCGGHIHIGAKYLDTKEAFGNFLILWLSNEESIYKMCNPSGEEFRKGTDHFARPISFLYENGDEEVFNNISKAQKRDELVDIIKSFQKGHFNGLNTDNMNSEKNDTIEFRISNGTLNFNEIQNNIRLYGRLMQRAKEVSIIQAKVESGQEITEEEQRKINDFENLCSRQGKKEENYQMLVNFLFEEDERETYISRNSSCKENSETFKNLFSKDAYKKLYKSLKPKDKDFSATISFLKDTKTTEKEDNVIGQ